MSKLNRKFILSIGIILLLIVSLSIYLNANFIERYFLHVEREQLNAVGSALIAKETVSEQWLSETEIRENVTIFKVDWKPDNDALNQVIKETMVQNNMSFDQYWLWDKDQADIEKHGTKLRVYTQEKNNYTLIIRYQLKSEDLWVVIKMVPALEATLKLVNQVNMAVFICAGILLFILISRRVYRIIQPLEKIREATHAISELDFVKIEIKTGDELETLSKDINQMSDKLEVAHDALLEKNLQMEALLANVSHDLKTPIALIHLYAQGIQDGMDDGTFIQTIISQSEQMTALVENLLELSKIKRQTGLYETMNISDVLASYLETFRILGSVDFDADVQNSLWIHSNREAVQQIFTNTITNAAKYALDQYFTIRLAESSGEVVYQIENKLNPKTELDLSQIWQPFYVAEKSRNKSLSGTGLGLSIVKALCEQYNIGYTCEVTEDKIRFQFVFKM